LFILYGMNCKCAIFHFAPFLIFCQCLTFISQWFIMLLVIQNCPTRRFLVTLNRRYYADIVAEFTRNYFQRLSAYRSACDPRRSNMNKLTAYLKGAIEEMKKVTWPTRKETRNYTYLVIGVSLGIAAFLGALDYVFAWGLTKVIK
jgi:preprotein translocase subunit SecE